LQRHTWHTDSLGRTILQLYQQSSRSGLWRFDAYPARAKNEPRGGGTQGFEVCRAGAARASKEAGAPGRGGRPSGRSTLHVGEHVEPPRQTTEHFSCNDAPTTHHHHAPNGGPTTSRDAAIKACARVLANPTSLARAPVPMPSSVKLDDRVTCAEVHPLDLAEPRFRRARPACARGVIRPGVAVDGSDPSETTPRVLIHSRSGPLRTLALSCCAPAIAWARRLVHGGVNISFFGRTLQRFQEHTIRVQRAGRAHASPRAL
jgi:hypothetical protein